MKHNDVIRHEDIGDRFYILYDETDINHCIMIGEYPTLKDVAKAAKEHKKNCPDAVIQAYEMIRE